MTDVKNETLYRREYLKRKPWAKHWCYAKSRASKKNWEMTLLTADFEILWFRDKGYELKRPSIDRIDPSKGYIDGNCRFIERSENCRLGATGKTKTQKQIEAGRRNLTAWQKKVPRKRRLEIAKNAAIASVQARKLSARIKSDEMRSAL